MRKKIKKRKRKKNEILRLQSKKKVCKFTHKNCDDTKCIIDGISITGISMIQKQIFYIKNGL